MLRPGVFAAVFAWSWKRACWDVAGLRAPPPALAYAVAHSLVALAEVAAAVVILAWALRHAGARAAGLWDVVDLRLIVPLAHAASAAAVGLAATLVHGGASTTVVLASTTALASIARFSKLRG